MLNSDGTSQTFEDSYKLPVLTWSFDDAPQALRSLFIKSYEGLRPGWIIHVPNHYVNKYYDWKLAGIDMYAPVIESHEIADGSVVFAGFL